MDRNTIGQYSDDLTESYVIQHALSKTIFESDYNLFCLIGAGSVLLEGVKPGSIIVGDPGKPPIKKVN